MPKLFITGIVLFLLLGAGYGAIQAARSIPWDCADWQAFAHEDRTTAILESLAENRGKTLYCGVDQSDTFAKAETWAAGKDRNERDNTVYYGERGHFRGFIAAQEGWLTEGESGITGQSIATIFEFPKEERQRRRKKREYLRDAVGLPPYHYNWYYGPERSSTTSQAAANALARTALENNLPTEAEQIRYVRSSRADFLASLPSDAERERYRQVGNRLRATLGGGGPARNSTPTTTGTPSSPTSTTALTPFAAPWGTNGRLMSSLTGASIPALTSSGRRLPPLLTTPWRGAALTTPNPTGWTASASRSSKHPGGGPGRPA